MHFDYVWLRDHCRSASCYNSKTNQRNLDTASIDLNIRPSKSRVDENNLFLTCKCRTRLDPVQLKTRRVSLNMWQGNQFTKVKEHSAVISSPSGSQKQLKTTITVACSHYLVILSPFSVTIFITVAHMAHLHREQVKIWLLFTDNPNLMPKF